MIINPIPTKAPRNRYVIIKLKNAEGHFVAWWNGSIFLIPDNTPSEEPPKNVRYFIDLNLRNKDV